MPHNLHRTELECRQRSKYCSIAESGSLNAAKKRLCIAILRAGIQTRPLFRVPARALNFAHSVQSMALESLDPALHRTAVLTEKRGHLSTAMATGDQRQAMQPVIATRLVGTGNFFADGDSHDFRICNFQLSYDDISGAENSHQDNQLVRHYTCRHV